MFADICLMRLKEIYRSPNYYSICKCERCANPVIYVIAGGVLMYELVVELTVDEFRDFQEVGHLDSLARQVAQDQHHFASRTLKPSTPDEKIEFVASF